MLPGHGVSGIEYFATIAPQICNAGYTVVTLDPRGVGESTGNLDSITLHDIIDIKSIMLFIPTLATINILNRTKI